MILVECKHKYSGCAYVLNLNQIENHEEIECEYRPCELCRDPIAPLTKSEHLTKVCPS